MRPLTIAGIVILCLGAYLLVQGGTFTSKRDVLKVGDLKITADEQQSIPPWAGGLIVVGGIAMIVAGARRKA